MVYMGICLVLQFMIQISKKVTILSFVVENIITFCKLEKKNNQSLEGTIISNETCSSNVLFNQFLLSPKLDYP